MNKASSILQQDIDRDKLQEHRNKCLCFANEMVKIHNFKNEIKKTEQQTLIDDFVSFLDINEGLTEEMQEGARLFLKYLLNS